MTIAGKIESTIAIPSGVTVSQDGAVLTVKGPKGELSRNFAHPGIDVAVAGEGVSVSCEYPRIKDKAMVGTYVAHIRNMIHGVTQGYTYHLKIVFSHFPMKVAVKGDRVEINNYMEATPPASLTSSGAAPSRSAARMLPSRASISRPAARPPRTSRGPPPGWDSTRERSRTESTSSRSPTR